MVEKALAPGISGPSGLESAHSSEDDQYLPLGTRLIVVAISLMLAVFCVALDNTIMAVAIPKITDQFHALNDFGWYASLYLLTTCSFQLLYGKFYTLFNIKWVFLTALSIFELGSAGIFTGALVTVAHTVPLEKRPIFFGLIGGMYGIASVAGPLLGGAFTEHATWRWCFYINLPIGAVTTAGLLTLLKLPQRTPPQKNSLVHTVRGLDPLGTMIFVPAFPVRIIWQRSITFASFFGLCIGASFLIMVYYIPIWFQAIRGASAVRSGIDSLPMILANVIGIILSGALTTGLGYYAPFFIASSISRWVGFLFLYGLGVGCGFQQGGVAAQAVLALPDVSVGTAIVMFLQMLGGALFTSVAQSLFTTKLTKNLAALEIPSLDSVAVIHAGATGLRELVTEEQLPAVLDAYNGALISTVGALGIEWRSVKKSDGVASMQD
ncbi:major facilitator superfamily domain-containing protein [Aspergillus tetrazonus]